MDLVLIQQIVSVLIQAAEAGIKYGPAIITDLKMAFDYATSGTTLTDEQLIAAKVAVENAYAALDAQLTSDIKTDEADSASNPQT